MNERERQLRGFAVRPVKGKCRSGIACQPSKYSRAKESNAARVNSESQFTSTHRLVQMEWQRKISLGIGVVRLDLFVFVFVLIFSIFQFSSFPFLYSQCLCYRLRSAVCGLQGKGENAFSLVLLARSRQLHFFNIPQQLRRTFVLSTEYGVHRIVLRI